MEPNSSGKAEKKLSTIQLKEVSRKIWRPRRLKGASEPIRIITPPQQSVKIMDQKKMKVSSCWPSIDSSIVGASLKKPSNSSSIPSSLMIGADHSNHKRSAEISWRRAERLGASGMVCLGVTCCISVPEKKASWNLAARITLMQQTG